MRRLNPSRQEVTSRRQGSGYPISTNSPGASSTKTRPLDTGSRVTLPNVVMVPRVVNICCPESRRKWTVVVGKFCDGGFVDVTNSSSRVVVRLGVVGLGVTDEGVESPASTRSTSCGMFYSRSRHSGKKPTQSTFKRSSCFVY